MTYTATTETILTITSMFPSCSSKELYADLDTDCPCTITTTLPPIVPTSAAPKPLPPAPKPEPPAPKPEPPAPKPQPPAPEPQPPAPAPPAPEQPTQPAPAPQPETPTQVVPEEPVTVPTAAADKAQAGLGALVIAGVAALMA